MFNLRQKNWAFLCLAALFSVLSFVACGDDEEEDNCAPNFSTTAATGSFMGSTFTVVDGMAEEDFADENNYRITLYGEMVTGDVCDNFNFDRPAASIIFSIPKEVGVYELGLGIGNTVTFNDASVINEVNAEVATCGAVEIASFGDGQLSGNIDISASTESNLNGTFSVRICP